MRKRPNKTEGTPDVAVQGVVMLGSVKLIALAAAMCQTLDDLGNTSMARISAREFAPYYRKKLKRIVKKYELPFGVPTARKPKQRCGAGLEDDGFKY